jgi:pimeloyl-ACP methyl ester carboxylesterase
MSWSDRAGKLVGSSRVRTLLAAPVFIPATWRVLDSLRRGDADGLDEDIGLEHADILSLDGTPLHLTFCGEGERTLFLVHGWTCNESVFRFQQKHFKDDYRICSLELRGHGASGIPDDLDYHPERLAEDLEAAVRYAKPGPFVVAGHSLGGFTTFKWFERFGRDHEGRLKGLAIIDSTGTDLTEGIVFGPIIKRLYPIPLSRLLNGLGRHNRISESIKTAIKDSSLAYGVVRWAAFGRKPEGRHVEHMQRMILATPMTSLALAAKACLDYRCEYYLPEVDVPVVLLLGDLDKLTSLEASARLADEGVRGGRTLLAARAARGVQ